MRVSLEIFQTLGALIGLVTGAFIFYDRLLRYRPFVSIYAEPDGGTAKPYLRVTNPAPFDVFINEIAIEPPSIRLSQDDTARGVDNGWIDEKITAVIRANESAAFHIIEPPTTTDAGKKTGQVIKVKVRWHRSLPTSVIRPIAATITTSIEDIEERKRAASRRDRWAS